MQRDDPSPADAIITQAETLFEIHDNPSRVIGHLDIPVDQLEDNYDIAGDGIYDFEPMVRLFIYKHVCGDSQSELADRIDAWPYLVQRFGLHNNPTQAAISYTKRNRFSLSVRQLIEHLGNEIRALAETHGVTSSRLADPDQPDPEEVAQSDQPLHQYVDEHAPELIKQAQQEVFSAFDTGRAANITHSDDRVFEHQMLMSLQAQSGTRAAYRSFNKFRDDALHHDTHTRAIKKLGKPDDYQYTLDEYLGDGRPTPHWRQVANTIQDQYSNAIGRIVDLISTSETFTQPVTAAIDITPVPFHSSPWKSEDDIEPEDERIVVDEETGTTNVPKEDYPTLVQGGKESNTYEYQYATLSVIAYNVPIVIAVEPVRHDSTWEGDDGWTESYAEIVDRLMDQATQHLDIHTVMADREFDSHGVLHVLDQHDVTYLIPKKTDSNRLRGETADVAEDETLKCRVERGASLYLTEDTPYVDLPEGASAEDRYSHDVAFMHVPADEEEWAVDEDNEYALFVTNRENVTPADALGFTETYSYRWDIENEYKSFKPLLPSIASTDYRMRFFAFCFSTLLYNLWRMIDHSLKELATERYDEYGRGPHEDRLDPVLPLSDFLFTFTVLNLRRGLDPPG